MKILNLRPYKPRREPRRHRRTPDTTSAERWNPPPSKDDDTTPMVMPADGPTVVLSTVAGLAGVVMTGLIIWPTIGLATYESFSVHSIAARLLWLVLTGWIPFILFAYALRPLAHTLKLQRSNRVLVGISNTLVPFAGPLGTVRSVSFLSAHRPALLGAFSSACIGAAGLLSLIVDGLVIESAQLTGSLGLFGTIVVGSFFMLALLAGTGLPFAWWRRDRRMRRIASNAHVLEQ